MRNLREYRLKQGWTIRALAKKAGVAYGFLSEVEHGKTNISVDKALRLARVLGVTVESLCGSENNESRNSD